MRRSRLLLAGGCQYAVYTEVNLPDGVPVERTGDGLQTHAVPHVHQAGAVHAYWMEPHDGRAVGVVLFDDEQTARAAAAGIEVGAKPRNAPVRVTYGTVRVQKVIAHL